MATGDGLEEFYKLLTWMEAELMRGGMMAKLSMEKPKPEDWARRLEEVWKRRDSLDWDLLTNVRVEPDRWKLWELQMHRPLNREEVLSILDAVFSGQIIIK